MAAQRRGRFPALAGGQQPMEQPQRSRSRKRSAVQQGIFSRRYNRNRVEPKQGSPRSSANGGLPAIAGGIEQTEQQQQQLQKQELRRQRQLRRARRHKLNQQAKAAEKLCVATLCARASHCRC